MTRCPDHGRNPKPACLKCDHGYAQINNRWVQGQLDSMRVDNSDGKKLICLRKQATANEDLGLYDEGSW